ncbi:MAG: HlyD family efflux transporter periplasmic adaptor subunit, partial [Lysobacterales bacterium]
MKKLLIRIIGLAIVLGGSWYGYRFFKSLPERQENVANAKVRQGDVVIRAFTRGELRAVRSVTLTAPNLFGTVQVTRLAPMGSMAKEKDLIAEFDDSERRAALEETLLEVEQIDEQIKKVKADLAIRDNQDQVSLLQARYNVRRAELEVKRNELISAIDARKNVLNLEEARRRLKQLENDIQSRKQQGLASLAVLNENRNKSMIDVQREKNRIAQAKILSPMTGLVAVKQNRGGFMIFGQQVPDLREGDTVQPGMPIADVLDLSELEVVAKVGELDRANLHEGQEVSIALDAVAEKRFQGRIKGMSGTASANIFSGDPSKKFDVIFSIDMRRLLSTLG